MEDATPKPHPNNAPVSAAVRNGTTFAEPVVPGRARSGPRLAHFSRLRNLWGLELNGTAITGAGLAHLNNMTNLKRLFLDGTAVTDNGVEELQKAWPDREIHR